MPPCKPACFDLELRPSRPFRQRQVRWLLAGVLAVCLLLALRLAALGAWPILPFLALAPVALYLAFRASARSGRQSEHLRLDARGLELVRIDATGHILRTRIEPFAARVELERISATENRLWLNAGEQRHPVGSFLSPDERAEIAHVIEDGLARFRAEGTTG